MPAKISKDDLLEELHRLADRVDSPVLAKDMDELGAYTAQTYRNRFGSWGSALEEAGLGDLMRSPPAERLLDELQRLADKAERTPTQTLMAEEGKFSHRTYERQFGTWVQALEKAGLELDPRQHQNIPKADLLRELERLTKEKGRPPSAREMDSEGKYATNAYDRKFGSWNEAVRLVGLDPAFKPVEDRERSRSIQDHYVGKWKQIREEAIRRDSKQCVRCGMTRDEHYEEVGVDLHVHHETPVREFEKSQDADDLSNLTTLCIKCHGVVEHADDPAATAD